MPHGEREEAVPAPPGAKEEAAYLPKGREGQPKEAEGWFVLHGMPRALPTSLKGTSVRPAVGSDERLRLRRKAQGRPMR